MRYLKSYNEGIVSSAVELINRSKETDKKAQKYIQMIYDDWNKHKDLYRVSIVENIEYTTMRYLITTGHQNDVQLGNRDENSITIELTYINNILSWSSDKTKGRIEVTKFKSYLGEMCVFGRIINSGKIIDDINGVKEKEDPISYVNISSAPIKKLIEFFTKEFKKKYPTIEKYYGKRSILQTSEEAREEDRILSRAKQKLERDEFERKRQIESELVKSKVELLKMDKDDILDYFVELEDDAKIKIDYRKSIYIGDSIYDQTQDGLISKFSLNGDLNRNRYKFTENSIPLEKNIPYHRIIVKLYDDEYDVEKFKERVDKIIKRLGFGLKVKASNFSDLDREEFNREYGLSFLEVQGGINASHQMFGDGLGYRYASYMFYLSEI